MIVGVARCTARRCLMSTALGCAATTSHLNVTSTSIMSHKLGDFGLQTRVPLPLLNTASCRGYSKSKGRPHRPKMALSDEELLEVLRVNVFRNELSRALQKLGDHYLKTLSINNPAAHIESLMVPFDGNEVQLCEVAHIQKKPNLVVLQFTSFPEAIKPAMKAIEDSGVRCSMQQDSTSVFLQLPKVTRDQREDMAKNAKQLFQKCKDELVQVERRAIKEIQGKKEGQSQDLIFNAQQQVKFEIEQTLEKAEAMMKSKQKELLNE